MALLLSRAVYGGSGGSEKKRVVTLREAWTESGETITSIVARFGVSHRWIHQWGYPVPRDGSQ